MIENFLIYISDFQSKLPAGTHIYPFNFMLPPDLPSSFESEHGKIIYTIKAVIDRPMNFDHTTTVTFEVVSILDLNEDLSAFVSYLCIFYNLSFSISLRSFDWILIGTS